METEKSRPRGGRGGGEGMPGPKPEGASPGAQHGTAAAAKLLIRARRPGCGSSGSIGVTVSLPLLETRFIAFKSQIRKTITRPPTIWRRGNPIQTKGVSPSQVLQIQTEVSPRTLARAAPPVGSWDPSRPESHRVPPALACEQSFHQE